VVYNYLLEKGDEEANAEVDVLAVVRIGKVEKVERPDAPDAPDAADAEWFYKTKKWKARNVEDVDVDVEVDVSV
jgi:hypothetical protein